MFAFCRPSEKAAESRTRSSSTGRPYRFFSAAFGVDRPRLIRYLGQSLGLVWVTAAILTLPIVDLRRERAARETVKRLGGYYHVDRRPVADFLPMAVMNWFGIDNLHSLRSVNLSRSNATDGDLEILARVKSLEQVNLCHCPRVTTAGIARLRNMPRMKLVWVDGMTIEDASRCLMGESIASAAR